MNGSTAKVINKAAQKYRMNSRRLKREYQKLNHEEKREAKADMFKFCMGFKEAAADQAKKVRKEKVVKREKAKVKSVQKAVGSNTKRSKPPFLRRLIAWVLLKLRIWNFETSYRYERNFTTQN